MASAVRVCGNVVVVVMLVWCMLAMVSDVGFVCCGSIALCSHGVHVTVGSGMRFNPLFD